MKKLSMPAMGQQAASTSALALPAVPKTLEALRDERHMILLLPEWAALRVKWSGGTTETKSGVKVPVLNPAFEPLTQDERSWVENRIAEISAALSPKDGVVVLQYRGKTLVLSQEETKLLLVTDLMRSKPTAAMSEEGAAARGESYMFALEDVAVWALDLAIRGWHGGKTEGIKERDDFKWAPDSSVLRRAARLEMEPLYRLCERLIAARDAKPIAEIETR